MPTLISTDFYNELLLNRNRETYIKILLWNWNETSSTEIQGYVTSGEVSIDGNSPIRRSLSVEFVLDKSNLQVTNITSQLTLDKKIQVYIGVKNKTQYLGNGTELGEDIIWFNMGFFIATSISSSASATGGPSISIQAQDKMVLLNGHIAGELGVSANLYSKITNKDITYKQIIEECVSYFGGISKEKIKINIPEVSGVFQKALNEKQLYIDSEGKTFDANGELLTSQNGTSYKINSGDVISMQRFLTPFNTKGEEFQISPTDTIIDIIERALSQIPEEYEYFFDLNGDFILQAKPSLVESFLYEKFLNTTFINSNSISIDDSTNISKGQIIGGVNEIPPGTYVTDISGTTITLSNPATASYTGSKKIYFYNTLQSTENQSKYISNFQSYPYVGVAPTSQYDLKNIDVVTSYSEDPEWRGIKNDFYVYGKNGNGEILYHTVIDTPVVVPTSFVDNSTGQWTPTSSYNQPYQQYIIDAIEYYKTLESLSSDQLVFYNKYKKYYDELKSLFEYNGTTNLGIYKKIGSNRGLWRYEYGQRSRISADSTKDSDILTNVNFDSFLYQYSDPGAKEKQISSISYTTISDTGLYEVTATFSEANAFASFPKDSLFVIDKNYDEQYTVKNSYSNKIVFNYFSPVAPSLDSIGSISAISIIGVQIYGDNLDNQTFVKDYNLSIKEIVLSKPAKSTKTEAEFFIAAKNDFKESFPKGNPLSWNYFFDIISEENPRVSRFSVNSIGRRAKSINDPSNIGALVPIGMVYPVSSSKKVIQYKNMNKPAIELLNIKTPASGLSITATVADISDIVVGVDKVKIANALTGFSSLNGIFTITSKNYSTKTITFNVPSLSGLSLNTTYRNNFTKTGFSYKPGGFNQSSKRIWTTTNIQLLNDYKVGYRVSSECYPGGTYITSTGSQTVGGLTLYYIEFNTNAIKTVSKSTVFTFTIGKAYHFQIDAFNKDNEQAESIRVAALSQGYSVACIFKSIFDTVGLDSSSFMESNDAYSSIKNLIHTHTTFNDSIKLSAIPMFFFEPNKKILVPDYTDIDINSQSSKEYCISSLSMPLSHDGLMSINAIKVE